MSNRRGIEENFEMSWLVYMNQDWVIHSRTTFHIQSLFRLIWAMKNLIPVWNLSQIRVPTFFWLFLYLYIYNTWMNLPILRTIFMSFRLSFQSEILIQAHVIMSRYFIPDRAFDQEWNIKRVRTQYSDSCTANKYNSIPYGVNRKRMSSIWILTEFGFI